MKSIQERHQEDLAYNRMIWVSFPGSVMCRHLTMTEFEEAKKQFNKEAVRLQRETGADCVVYATKHYNPDGSIKVAFLGITPLTSDEYAKRTQGTNDLVYTVYKR